LSSGLPGSAPADAAPPPEITQLGEHLFVYHGPINVGIVRDGAKALVIDCGDGRFVESLGGIGIEAIDQVLFTHHHRDQACGAQTLAAAGARIVVPKAEQPYFDNVAAYWSDPKSRWHIYSFHPHHLMLAEPVAVDRTVAGGDTIRWGPATLGVLDTPGHTDGSVSYVVEVDGRRTVFSGDAIYDAGQVWDIYSLQKGTQTRDYHGFLGAKDELVASLGRIVEARPDMLVPSHGRIMNEPPQAVHKLVERLGACYERYVAISALRHYFPKLFTDYAGRPGQMPIRPGKPVPECLRHQGTTWLLVSRDGAALAMDCGSARVVPWLKELIEKGEIHSVEGLWVTHYHDDHVDAIPEFQKAFDCPCITDRHVADVIGNPAAWRLPCVSPSAARVDRPTADGQSWTWHEFKLTAYHLPGQTLYHSGLFVERGDLRMLFAGDSFTMSGIDDYCAQNRNWLGRDVGFDRCIALIERLRPTHVFNCHVADAFDFTAEECRFMRANLAEREELFGKLVPWEHPNYGMDESWVRPFPYEQEAKAGSQLGIDVVLTNHSAGPRQAACRAVLPQAWGGGSRSPDDGRASAIVPAKSEAAVRVELSIPADAQAGRYVIPIDVRYGEWDLPQFAEAIVVVP
jgi:glyoxylase-like metal-dependent hydrolase (beta-lactamase superfamily II)